MVELFFVGLLISFLFMFVCVLLWRILRRLEWLCMYIKGLGDGFLKQSRDVELKREQRN